MDSRVSRPLLKLVRGLPGSGKSTLAQELATKLGWRHLEADMFHVGVDGQYVFDKDKINDAHQWCLLNTEKFMKEGYSVVVSNTFTQLWEMRPYIAIAERLGFSIQIIEVTGFWESTHNVPPEILQRMKDRWEPLDREEMKGWEW